MKMKKSWLGLCIASALLLGGCNEETKAKLDQQNQRVNALEAEVKHLQDEKAKLTQESLNFPALKTQERLIFDETQQVGAGTDGVPREVALRVVLTQSSVEWLNRLLLNQFNRYFLLEGATQQISNEAELLANIKTMYQAMQKDSEQPDAGMGLTGNYSLRYLGQRGVIASFVGYFDSYTGGAHGIYGHSYLNVDVEKQAFITRDSLLAPEKLPELKALLWQANQQRLGKTNVKAGALDVPDNFYFTQAGVVFVYPLYELGAFAEGEIELTVPWAEINPLLAPAYQREDVLQQAQEKALEAAEAVEKAEKAASAEAKAANNAPDAKPKAKP